VTTRSFKGRRKRARRGEQKESPFYPNFVLRILMAIMATVAVIAILSALFPLPLDHIADPLAASDPGTRTLWILKPAVLLDNIAFSPGITVVLITIFAALFVILPLLDRSGQRSIKRRILVATPFLLWMLFLTFSLLFATGAPG
jgi:quinol-cytochrome oxidoreductase complex cytochrome b subunit